MKRTESLYRTAVLLLLLMLAAACTRDDTFDDAAPGNGTDPAAVLTITVTDGAYAPEASAANAVTDHGASVTRAVENGYATGFTKGDQIGLYVATASPDNSGYPGKFDTMLHENLCLTYDGTRWTLPAGTELKYDPAKGRDIFYFAYYPYQANMDGNEPDGNNPDGLPTDTAPEFFHALITIWKPLRDQSTYAAYAASDLMVARGEVATRTDGTPGSTLSFNMEHQMQLNIVRLPYIKSTYTEAIGGNQQTKSYYLYTGVAHLPYFWMENPHTARYITNPSGDVKKITGCSYYDSRSVERKFEIEIPNDGSLLRGKYKTYTVDNATETKSNRGAPQEGDFYMKDGTVLPQETFGGNNPPSRVVQDCIGVVFWVGVKYEPLLPYHWALKGHQGDDLLMYEHPACTHGLVVALKDAANGEKKSWSNGTDEVYYWLKDKYIPATDEQKEEIQRILRSNQFWGYTASHSILWYRDYAEKTTEAYDAVEQYAKENATPAGCSGWYFPSIIELTYMAFGTMNYINNNDKHLSTTLNAQFKKVGGDEFKNDYYWSSVDFNDHIVYCIKFDDNKNMRDDYEKTSSHYVRAVLAF